MALLPEKLIEAKVYKEGADLIGIADVELPDIDMMTETISGFGITGEIESPVLGHFKSMVLKLKWRNLTDEGLKLAAQKTHNFDIRGSIQRYQSVKGEYETYPVKVVVKGVPKKLSLGKLEVGKRQDKEDEFEVIYIKVWVDNKEIVEIDKVNFICKIDGVDYLASVRKDLGM